MILAISNLRILRTDFSISEAFHGVLISNFVGDTFLSSSVSGSKPWDNLVFALKTFKKYDIVSYFLKLRETMWEC